tara:strand:- start:170 stop:1465 length:1296 start_codon:yes stop_codon:yes gene_type:complete
MKKILIFISLAITLQNTLAQCTTPTLLNVTDINYYNANLNWNITNNTHHYKIRYQEIGATNWLYKNNIDSLVSIKSLNNLNPFTQYIWQIRAYCDSNNVNISSWSVKDTFFTINSNLNSVTGLYTNNISYNTAKANWTLNSGANRYKLHYRIYGTSNWQNLATTDSTTNNIDLPNLQQNTTYEWEVMAYYDSTMLMASLWSITDTFTTTNFIAAAFNPNINSGISDNYCNAKTTLNLNVSQNQNEPDISTTTITSDGGYFDIQTISTGDTIGYAIMNTSIQSIYSFLIVGLVPGPSYAIINSYDSTGSLIGFFAIENVNSGIKVSSTSPNDGNNYTNGYTSEIKFYNLFVNPNIDGDLNFYADIQSEIGDQFNKTNTIAINCISSINNEENKELNKYKIYNIQGKKSRIIKNKILILIDEKGRSKKIMCIE